MSMGGFEMQRMLRQNAHEKAFEIAIVGQRNAERKKNVEVEEGHKLLKDSHKKKMNELD